MSLCHIPLLTSLETLHDFASNLVWVFLGWTPSKFVKILHIWFGESPGDLIFSLFKLGHCDLYLQFQLTLFVKHIFDISQTPAQILIKFGSYMHLSKVTQVGSNEGCMTYFHLNMLMRCWLVA